MRIYYLCLIFLLAFSVPSVVHSSQAENAVKKIAVLFGYAGICAEISGVKDTSQDKQETNLFIKKFLAPYKSLGQTAYDLFLENIHLGMASGGMENGAQCEKVLNELISRYKSYGLSGRYLEKVLNSGKFRQTPRIQNNSSEQSSKIKSGLYRVHNDEGALPSIILKSNKTGSFEIDEDSNPFIWEINGDKLIFDMLDDTLPKEQKNFNAIINNNEEFTLAGNIYKINNDVKILSYKYLEDGYSGDLTLYDLKSEDEVVIIEIQTVENTSGNTCEVKVECNDKGAMLICRDNENDDKDAMITITDKGNDSVEIASTISTGYYCGNRASFIGKYTLNK